MKKVILFGTFDILHVGHINLFEQAKKYGDQLIVVVARDKNVVKSKKKKAMFTEKERIKVLYNIKLIDRVVLGSESNYYQVIKKNQPDVIALGYDQEDYVSGLEEFLEKNKINTKIVRLKSYKPQRFKSHKIREYIESII